MLVTGGVVCVCAMLGRHLTRWYSRVDIQGVRQEIADGLKVCFKAALEHYQEVCVTVCDVCVTL